MKHHLDCQAYFPIYIGLFCETLFRRQTGTKQGGPWGRFPVFVRSHGQKAAIRKALAECSQKVIDTEVRVRTHVTSGKTTMVF